jgi:pimeloyl-ACP methyl ester carboxylesterase
MKCLVLLFWLLLLSLPVHSQAPLFDVPKLDAITIDGDAEDWKKSGFQVNALSTILGKPRAASDLFGALRLGWDTTGLLVFVMVRDDIALETPSKDDLWQRDSVELFLGTKRGVGNFVQFLIGPGIDPKTPELRVATSEHRVVKSPPMRLEVVAKKISGGYLIEARIPWEQLGISPKLGSEVAFQITINDSDSTAANAETAQLAWHPEGSAYNDPKKMQRLRLSTKPTPAILVAARPDYSRFPKTRLAITAPPELVGKTIKALGGSVKIGLDGRAELFFNQNQNTDEVRLTVSGAPAFPIFLRDPDALRAEVLKAARLKFEHYVFTSEEFPAVDLVRPEALEAALGGYQLQTEFYDADQNLVTKASKIGRYGAMITIQSRDKKWTEKRHVMLFRAESYEWWETPNFFRAELPTELGFLIEANKLRASDISDTLRDAFFASFDTDSKTASLLAALFETKPTDAPVKRIGAVARDNRYWFALEKKRDEFRNYNYLARAPKEYESDRNKKWPLLIFLHGSGESGDNLDAVKVHGPLSVLESGRELPFIVVAPQCPDENDWWQPERVMALIEEITQKYRVDPDRIYLTGLSMGGYGTWSTALAYPERFAAIAPISGGGDPSDAARLVDLPSWTFHGAKDNVVPARLASEMTAALQRVGARVARLTIYPDAGHNAWTETYDNPKFYDWLLSHKKP